MDKLKESTSLTNHAGDVSYADVAFETSPRFSYTPLVCSLLCVVRVSIMVLWSSVTELTLAQTVGRWSNPWPVSQTSCPWEHVCAGAEDDGRLDGVILGKSFSRHDIVRPVCASRNQGCSVFHEQGRRVDCNPTYNDMDDLRATGWFRHRRVHSGMEGPELLECELG